MGLSQRSVPLRNKYLPLIFHSLLELNKLIMKFTWENEKQTIARKTKSKGEKAYPTEYNTYSKASKYQNSVVFGEIKQNHDTKFKILQ